MKTSKKLTMLAGVAMIAIMMFSSIGSTSAAPGTPTPFREVNSLADNGWKYPLVSDSVVSALYQEWWYFQVVDPNTDLFFTCWYEIDNPAGETMDGMEIPRASYVGSEGFYGDYRFVWPMLSIDLGEYTAATDTWNVNIAGNTIVATDLNTVEIIGYDIITEVSWDLTFTRNVVAGTYTDAVPTGFSPTDILGWCSVLPVADVTGTITINGEVIAVDLAGAGYSDHNWGSPEILSYAPWLGSFSEDMIILAEGVPSMTAPKRNSNGFINVWFEGAWIWFKVPTIVYTWAVDPVTGGEYISNFHFVAKSIDNKWIININAELVGEYSFDLFDFGPYFVSFFKSFEFQVTGTLRHLTFPDIFCPTQIDQSCHIEENFFIPKA